MSLPEFLLTGAIFFTYLFNKLRNAALMEILSRLEMLFVNNEISEQNYEELKSEYDKELQEIEEIISSIEKRIIQEGDIEKNSQRLKEIYEQSKGIFGQYILDLEERKFEEKLKSLRTRITLEARYDIEGKK